MNITGRGKFELRIDQPAIPGLPDLETGGFVQLNVGLSLRLEPDGTNDTFRLQGEFIPNRDYEFIQAGRNKLDCSVTQLVEILAEQEQKINQLHQELAKWKAIPNTDRNDELGWLRAIANMENYDQGLVGALCDWLEERGDPRKDRIKKFCAFVNITNDFEKTDRIIWILLSP